MTPYREFANLLVVRDRSALCRLHTILVGAVLATGCGLPDEPEYGVIDSEVSVGTYTTTSCSTSVVVGLSKQIAEEVGCMNPGALVKFSPTANLRFTSNAVLPYLNSAARANLLKVAETRVVQVNSGFRTVAQQYLLYRWFQLGRCGIPAAATPGRSNHEGGRAVDLQNYSSLVSAMAARGWSHNVPGDPVHFEHLSSPDIRGKDVLAFQRLHNRNNPNNKIVEDGAYGPMTAAGLRAAPATGFAKGPLCGQPVPGVDVVMIDGPDKIAPSTKAHFAITVRNTGDLTWPAGTKLIVADGTASELYSDETWTSPTEVGPLGVEVAKGAQHIIDLEVAVPAVTEETPMSTQFALASSGKRFGIINIAVTVTPNGDEGTSGDSPDENDPEMESGCNAGGGTSWTTLLVPVLIVLRRRRRRTT